MELRPVKLHKMYKEFQDANPKELGYMGEYDDTYSLIAIYNKLKEKMIRIEGTYQWILPSSGEVYFVEEDTVDDH